MRPLVLAVLCLLFAGSALNAQQTTVDMSLVDILWEDLDGSGTPSCGEEINYILTINGNDPAIDPQNTWLRIPYDPNATLVPGTVLPTNTNDAVTIVDGLDPGDTFLQIGYGRICTNSSRCATTGASLSFRVRINVPNAATQISHQATLIGSNFPNALSDDPGTTAIDDPTETDFPLCAGAPPPSSGPFVRAFKTWALVTDRDADGLVDEGDTVRYTVNVRNTIPGTEAAGGLVFLTNVDPSSTLVVGSVTTNRGSVIEGNSAGNTRVQVQIGTMALNAPDTVIRFDAVVRNSVPASVVNLSCQGTVTGSNIPADVLTDDPFTPSSPDPTITPLDFDPDLTVVKSDGGVLAVPGITVAYDIKASNLSRRSRADNIVLTEIVPAGSTFNAGASSPGWTCVGSGCTLFIPTLAPNASVDRVFAVRPDNPFPAGIPQLDNSVRISDGGENGPDRDLSNNQATDTTPLDPAAARPDLRVTKSDGDQSVNPDDVVVYQIDFGNFGNRGTTGVVLTETVPARTTFEPLLSSPGWTCAPGNGAGATCTRTIGGLAGGGAGGTASFTVRLTPTVPAGFSQIQNTVSIADSGANGTDANPADNTATDSTPVIASPDLRIAKQAPATPGTGPGGLLVWTLAFSNAGNQDAADVVLNEAVPEGTTFEASASNAGWVCVPNANAGSSCALAVGDVAAGGAAASSQFAVRILPVLPPGVETIANCARIQDGTLSAESCASYPVPSATPDLAVTKTDLDATAAPGDTVVYHLTVRNLGTQGATGIVLTETVPIHTTFAGASSSPGWSCADGATAGTVCSLAVGPLDAGASSDHLFAVRLDSPLPAGVLQIANVVSVADDGANGPDPNTADNMASDTTPVEGAGPGPGPGTGPRLVATKQDELGEDLQVAGEANPGDSMVYNVVVSNLGDAAALDVVFTSPAPAHTALLAGSVTTSAGTVVLGNGTGDTTVRVDLGTLAAGASAVVTFAVRIDAGLPPSVTEIVCQGRVLSSNSTAPPPTPADPPGTVLTDDPDSAEPADPTRTPVARQPEGGIAEVPTLGSLGLIALSLALAGFAVFRLRRRDDPLAQPLTRRVL